MNPFDYFKFRYYEKWLGGITQFFIDRGYVTEAELISREKDLAAAAGATFSRSGPGHRRSGGGLLAKR